MNRTRLVFFAYCWFASSLAFAQPEPTGQFAKCDADTVRTLKQRLFVKGDQLRPVVLSQDVLHLSICDSTDSAMQFQRVKKLLDEKYVLENADFALDPARAQSWSTVAREACATSGPCKVEVYRRRGTQSPREFPFAKSGGLPFAAFLGHAGDKGHYEITGRAIDQLKASGGWRITPQAREALQDASRDPDFYDWGDPRAHAQSRNHADTGEIDESDISEAPRNFERWVADHVGHAVALCRDKKFPEAIYLLGYGAHAVQDLAFHEGITNAEHSYLDFVEQEHTDDESGVRYAQKMSLAVRATAALFSGFAALTAGGSTNCWSSLAQSSTTGRLDTQARQTLLRKTGKDFGVGAYVEYRGLASKLREAIQGNGVPKERFLLKTRWLEGTKTTLVDGFVGRILAEANR